MDWCCHVPHAGPIDRQPAIGSQMEWAHLAAASCCCVCWFMEVAGFEAELRCFSTYAGELTQHVAGLLGNQ